MTGVLEPLFPGPVETRLGRLDFEVGYPTPETTAKLYDELDLQRGPGLHLGYPAGPVRPVAARA